MARDYAAMITEIRSKANRISQENAKIDGEISAVTKKMKKEYGVHSVEDAKKMIVKLNGEITEITKEIDSEIYQIKEILDGFDE